MSTPPIAVVGENLVDLLVAPDASVNAVIGGGPLNVARTVGRLGGDARFVSGVSADAFGAFVRDSLHESRVVLTVPRELPQPTTLAVVELNPEGPGYHFHLNGTAAFALEEREYSQALGSIKNLAALYFGTLGLVVEPMASRGEALVVNTSQNTLVVIDPNCRPSAVVDYDEYRQRINRLCARADVVKVSTEDLAYLHPHLPSADGAREILQHGAAIVIVTDGAAPVRVIGVDVDLEIEVAPAEVIDTVGAGDALVGGFLTWWTGHDLTRDDLHDAPTLHSAVVAAIDVSRLTCQKSGAQPPRRDQVSKLEGWRWL